jgi:hypothetical protein
MRFGINRLLRSGRRAWPGANAACGLGQRDRNRRRLQPALLALEDRRLLSTFTVDSVADSAPADSPAQGTLRWAVEQANEATTPSTIDFNLGSSPATITLSQGQLVLSNAADSITIDGPGASSLSISGNDASRVFQVDNGVTASISGLTITGGSTGKYSFSPGGGLYNDGGTLTLTGSTITGNSTYGGLGGGLAAYGGVTNLTDCAITGNSAGYGGGLGSRRYATVTLMNTTISGNSAHPSGPLNQAGGGFENGGDSTATLAGCTISDNSASGTGGGVSNAGTISLSNCTISGNSASVGGGLNSNPGVAGAGATLTDCTISGNFASDGGGVANGSDKMALTGCTIINNYVLIDGGGVDNYGEAPFTSTAVLTDCTVSGNNTSSNANQPMSSGGGINNAGAMTLAGCTVGYNSSYSGGGIVNYGTLTATGSAISDNSALREFGSGGGGVLNGRYGMATFTDCTISSNSASAAVDAGGGGVSNGGTAILTDCTISGNSAQNGGGVDESSGNGGTVSLTGCTISGNSAYFGGGLDGTATLSGCTISGNSARYGGGASGDLTLTNCTVAENSAYSGGGISGFATLTDCTIVANSASLFGGGFDSDSGLASKLTGTIVADNTAAVSGTGDIGGTVTGSYNLIGTGGSGGLTNNVDGNVVGVANPLLAPLGNYGGSTQTIAPLPGSPAIGNGTAVSTIATDQRGAPRPTSGATDIGAFQDQGYTLVVSSGSGQTATVGQAFAAPLVAVLTENFADAPLPGATISFSAPAMGAGAAISSSTAVTDANGLASITATANNIAGSYAVTATALGVTPAASFSLTNTTAGPTNVTNDLSVSLGGFVYNRGTREFTQTLTFKNISDAAITGPIELVLLDLSNATLVNQSGVTEGSPYITVLSSGSLGVGQSLTVTLIFADPTLATITYTPEFLAGPIPSEN